MVATLLLDEYAENLTKRMEVIELKPGAVAEGTELGPLEAIGGGDSAFDKTFQRALSAQRLGNLDEAEKLYEELVATRPNHFESHYNLGLVELQKNSPRKAAELLRKAANLAAGTRRARALCALATATSRSGDVVRARKLYERAIQFDPDYLLPRYNLAVSYIKEGTEGALKEAEKWISQILSLQPDAPQGHYLLGRLGDERKDWSRALREYRAAARLSPGYFKARRNAAAAALKLGKIELAEKLFSELAEDFPSESSVPFYLGRIAYQRGDMKKATDLFRRALELSHGKSRAARVNLALAMKAMGRFQQALRQLDEILSERPRDAEVLLNRALVLKRLERYQEAKEALQAAISAKPDYAAAFYNLGKLEADSGHLPQAEAAYRKAVELDPGNVKAALNLGVLLARNKRYSEASEVYGKLLSRVPGYPPAWFNLGIALSKMGKTEQAEKAYLKVLELAPLHKGAKLNLGVIWARQGKTEKAIGAFRDVLDIDPVDTKARYNLALQYLKTGRYAEAEQQLKKVLKLDPRHGRSKRKLVELLRRQGRESEADRVAGQRGQRSSHGATDTGNSHEPNVKAEGKE
ncbi:MAG: tetratricopeptide repeat protein [Deltaproteobacteria bacterium]|nr:MAG: tetratricopeptide repeat protein [Deltaproteobacteria bacterium]